MSVSQEKRLPLLGCDKFINETQPEQYGEFDTVT